MRILILAVSVILFILAGIIISQFWKLKNIKYAKPEILSDKKILTVYYSSCGNTESVAQNIRSVAGGDIKEIILSENYPKNIFTMSKLVRKQMKENYLPKTETIDISNYDVIFVGSPIWNFSASLPLKSFLKNNNFENKTIIPFFTYSGGAAKNRVFKEIKDLTNAKAVKNPLFMFENGIFMQKEQIIKWLNNIQ